MGLGPWGPAHKKGTLICSFLLLALFHECLGEGRMAETKVGNECQIDQITALEPTHRIEAEAGLTEIWESNEPQFRCAGVTIIRRTIERNGLLLPSFTNVPELIYVEEGNVMLGMLMPGCPETYESLSMSEGPWQGQQGQSFDQERDQRQGQGQHQHQGQGERFDQERDQRQGQHQHQGQSQGERFEERGRGGQRGGSYEDMHQKIRHFHQGDFLALPAGVAHWAYNVGDQRVVAVILLHNANQANQLDQDFPWRFYLAGNPQPENPQHQQHGHGQGGGNVLGGFATRFLAEAFGVSEDIAWQLQGEEDKRGNIVLVDGGLQVIRPPASTRPDHHQGGSGGGRHHDHDHDQGRGGSGSGHHDQRGSGGGRHHQGGANGLEETICSARLHQNVDDPDRTDIYNPEAGRLTTVNSYNLPILQFLQLSAEKGVLYRNAILAPRYNLNAHEAIYCVRGQAWIQIVDHRGEILFDDELRQGQVVVVPQNFAIAMQTNEEEGFEWISFKTNGNAMVQTLAGRTSAIRAIPEEIIVNMYQISRDQARQLKYSREETMLFRSSRSQFPDSKRRAVA